MHQQRRQEPFGGRLDEMNESIHSLNVHEGGFSAYRTHGATELQLEIPFIKNSGVGNSKNSPSNVDTGLREPPLMIRWEGYLMKRSDWLKHWETYYFVLHGRVLYCYLSEEEAKLHPENSRIKHGKFSFNDNVIIDKVISIRSRTNFEFIFETDKGKEIHLRAKSEASKQLWMHMACHGIVDTDIDQDNILHMLQSPQRNVTLVDFFLGYEFFFATLSNLKDISNAMGSYDDKRERQSIMHPNEAIAIFPSKTDHILGRFFSMCQTDIAMRNNYMPMVPFQGTYRGYAGILEYFTKLTKAVAFQSFQVDGMSFEGEGTKRLVVVKGQESMEVRGTGRIFSQEWVHKFLVKDDGRIYRWEISGDIVSSSVAFKHQSQGEKFRESSTTFELVNIPNVNRRDKPREAMPVPGKGTAVSSKDMSNENEHPNKRNAKMAMTWNTPPQNWGHQTPLDERRTANTPWDASNNVQHTPDEMKWLPKDPQTQHHSRESTSDNETHESPWKTSFSSSQHSTSSPILQTPQSKSHAACQSESSSIHMLSPNAERVESLHGDVENETLSSVESAVNENNRALGSMPELLQTTFRQEPLYHHPQPTLAQGANPRRRGSCPSIDRDSTQSHGHSYSNATPLNYSIPPPAKRASFHESVPGFREKFQSSETFHRSRSFHEMQCTPHSRPTQPHHSNLPPQPYQDYPTCRYSVPSASQCGYSASTYSASSLNGFDEAITSSTPFMYPLGFKKGNMWPDAPVPQLEDVRLSRATELDLCRSREDIALYLNIAAKTIQCPIGTVCIVGSTAGLFVAKLGMKMDTIPRDILLESHVIMSSDPTIVLDTTLDIRFATNPLVSQGDMGIRFYIGIPLITSDNIIMGGISLIDTIPRQSVRERDIATLVQIAQTIMNRVEDLCAVAKGSTADPSNTDSFERQKQNHMEID